MKCQFSLIIKLVCHRLTHKCLRCICGKSVVLTLLVVLQKWGLLQKDNTDVGFKKRKYKMHLVKESHPAVNNNDLKLTILYFLWVSAVNSALSFEDIPCTVAVFEQISFQVSFIRGWLGSVLPMVVLLCISSGFLSISSFAHRVKNAPEIQAEIAVIPNYKGGKWVRLYRYKLDS